MTAGGLAWYQWLAAAAAAITVFGWLWLRVLRPLIRAIRRASQLLDRLFDILDDWPTVQAAVVAHAGELTTIAFQVGELSAAQKGLRRDVNELFRRNRREHGEPAPETRRDPPV